MERCLQKVEVITRCHMTVQVMERCLQKAEDIARCHMMVQVIERCLWLIFVRSLSFYFALFRWRRD